MLFIFLFILKRSPACGQASKGRHVSSWFVFDGTLGVVKFYLFIYLLFVCFLTDSVIFSVAFMHVFIFLYCMDLDVAHGIGGIMVITCLVLMLCDGACQSVFHSCFFSMESKFKNCTILWKTTHLFRFSARPIICFVLKSEMEKTSAHV